MMLSPTAFLTKESWALLVCALLLLRYYIKRKWSVLKQWNIPHDPPSLYDFGNVRPILSDNFFSYELGAKNKYGPIWGFYAILSPRVVVHDLEILRQVCIKEFSTFPNRRDACLQLLGKESASGLIGAINDQWRRTRATMAPVFSSSKLREMSEIVERCVDETVKVLERVIHENNREFVSRNVFGRLSLDVICSAAFSVQVNSQDPRKGEIEMVKQAKNYAAAAFFNFLNFVVIVFPFLEPLCIWLGGLRECVKYFKRTCKGIMEDRSNEVTKGRTDLMRLMLESKVEESLIKNHSVSKGLTTNEIIGNAMTMLVAGYETTGNAMNYLAYNLATHPDVQSKLQAEVDELYEREKNPTFSAINDLKFLEMCIDETLRLYPPVPGTIRTANKDITLSGLTIPKGWGVSIPIYALSHDPEYWDDPMEFKPERMENVSNFHPLLLLPFGAGPRNCIGSKFALMEMKMAFTKLLRHFTFRPTIGTPKPPLQLVFGGTSRPKIDYSLSVVARS